MILKRVLFVGGPSDGEFIQVTADSYEWIVAEVRPRMFDAETGERYGPLRHTEHRYYRETLKATSTFQIYRYEAITLDEMMMRLINGYKGHV